MNKKLLAMLLFIFLNFSFPCYADALYTMVNLLRHMDKLESQSTAAQTGIYNSQLDIENLMKQVNSSVTGTSGWGTYQVHDYQSYGDNAHSWNDVMQLINSGGGAGDLGQAIYTLSNQFPIDKASFNNGINSPIAQTYYAVQSQTVLATRAASELDYSKVQDQIAYQQMLQQQIENAKDLKSAVDLNNRIQVESNLINLAILRQSALSNQQKAISDQANINSSLLNAKFLTKQ